MGAVYQWYYDHLTGLTEGNRVYLLTDSLKGKQDYCSLLKPELKQGVITMEEFIKMEAQRYPELVNYMGFTESIETQEEDEKMRDVSKSQPLFEDHLSFDEMVLGIREGRFFKGRINISRVNIDESTVMVEGLTDDILVLGAPNQNRALNGDIVCLQILQEKEWVRHFK